jgi:hypothetical protein
MNLDPLSEMVLIAGACVALASILTVLYDAIKTQKMKKGSQTLSVKPVEDQNLLEIQEIKQKEGSLIIKVSFKKSEA